MSLVRYDFRKRNPRASGIEGMHDGARFRRWEQPVRGERDHAKTRRCVFESVRQYAAAIRGKIEIVHRARKIEVGICVEALDEAAALVAQVAFDLEIRIE